jgi:hypothetical protein
MSTAVSVESRIDHVEVTDETITAYHVDGADEYQRREAMRIGLFACRLAIFLGMMSRAEAWQGPTIEPQEKLNARIPAADPAKYRSVRDAEDWLNPYLLIQKNGVVMISRTNRSDRTPISIDELRRTLLRLPVSAWPYGRVVGAKDNSFGGYGPDDEGVKRNHRAVAEILKAMDVEVDWWAP